MKLELPSDFANHIAEVDPALYTQWRAEYVHARFEDDHCLRCGAQVKKKMRKLHKWHHHDLSLAIWAIGSTANALAREFEIQEEERIRNLT